MDATTMLDKLKAEKINTWFDLGLFIDRFKENREVPSAQFTGSFDDFLKSISKGGIAFITFSYSIDGATMESEKYVQVFKKILGNINLHYIAGEFHENSKFYRFPEAKCLQLDELSSFDNWPLYSDFFYRKLVRGGDVYNKLILSFWKEVIVICEKLGNYIRENDIKLLYIINTNSNPGNVSLALALVFISEYLGIPVICNNHDFYWEGGHSEIDTTYHNIKPGARDHFFKNYHLGEVFSILEMIYPWDSRSWLSVNINAFQTEQLIRWHGLNPANVTHIDTAIDFEKYHEIDDHRKSEIFRQLAAMFANNNGTVQVNSVATTIDLYSQKEESLKPVLIGADDGSFIDFEQDNIILLQPTRILSRKTIEINFTLIRKLFEDDEVNEYFEQNEQLKITILVSGPIATGHFKYFLHVIQSFGDTIARLQEKHRNKIFLGFMLSQYDKPSFIQHFEHPIKISELYNIASLVMLPSETEGRGLPIIEAAACGIPIFCRRYEPEVAYSNVIGEHLPKSERLTVIEFTDPELSNDIIELVKRQLFSPKGYEHFKARNKQIVEKRYSFDALVSEFEKILEKLYLQLSPEHISARIAQRSLEEYQHHLNENKEYASNLLNTNHRQYLPGYGQMGFMIFLKSLIDPSYFRVEEKKLRGWAMQFAQELVDYTPDPTPVPLDLMHEFFNSVDDIFTYRKSEFQIRHDHSLAYRHRNKNCYPYHDLTPQELTGVINLLYNKIIAPPPIIKIESSRISDNWNTNLATLYDNADLAIDNVEELEEHLERNTPIALVPGRNLELELELFALDPVRRRLGLEKNEKIHERFFDRVDLAPIYIIQREKSLGNSVTAEVLKSHIYYSDNKELKLLFERGVCKIIKSKQFSVGIHFYEIGRKAAEALEKIRDRKGILITVGDNAAMMTDIVDVDRIHIGKVSHILAEKILGIPMGSGYVQWVPAGLRFNLAFPTSVQDGKGLSKILDSFRFRKLCDSMGEENVLKVLKNDAEEKGTPIKTVLKKLDQSERQDDEVTHSSINDIYSDGLPWAGVLAHLAISKSQKKWHFSVVSTSDRPKTVMEFIEEFSRKVEKNVRIAWNGGYILNPELVGKLGIPEIFIGSPLGLIISEGKVLAPPLFNKSAFLVMPNGNLDIRLVNCSKGITIDGPMGPIHFSKESYNLTTPFETPCFYDLLYEPNNLPGNGRTLVRLAGNKIKEVISTEKGQNISVLPVGLTLSFPVNLMPKTWQPGQELNIRMNDWEEIESAIEAGPQLLKDAEGCINMELEGWKTGNSIRTQAARLDYTDMRGPKIAIGIDRNGDLSILAINGRIRESVGATHIDMAEILKAQGIVDAMGFDPGGSSTLVVDNNILNISPYNHDYEKDVYSLPPEPRAVANAIMVW